MKFSVSFCSAFLLGMAHAQTPGGTVTDEDAAKSVGTGPYPATFFEDPTLPQHTIYQPKNLPPGVKMPIVLWGNGGCIAVGTIMMPFLAQIASQGIIVIANGSPGNVTASFASYANAARSTSKFQIAAIDWAIANAGKGDWAHMDATRVAAAGQSCGGLETYGLITDDRVGTLGIFNSGNLGGGVSPAPTINKPIFYFLGGPTDVAYTPGTTDYKSLPKSTPAWLGNLPVGHGGTYNQVNGGKIGVAASYLFNWVLRGNMTAAAWFTDGTAAKADGWSFESQNLDKISVTPV